MFINFADLPAHQNLFLDYLYEFENAERFYKINFRDTDKYAQIFESVSSHERYHLSELKNIIKAQYDGKQLSKQTEININSLDDDKTIAIVTGQQLGIFGGPLYTFYKIITAIKLCAHLKEEHDQYKFIPVFWLEGDDHDFDEVRTTKIIDNTNLLKSISYDDGLDEETNRGPVAEIKLGNNIYDLFNELSESLRETDFKKEVLDLLKNHYQPGKTFLEAFYDLLFEFFDESGLIIFNPTDPRVKKLLKPIFKKEIEDFREHSEDVVRTSADLEEYYHAQIKIKPINIFLNENEGRFLLEPVDDEFRLKGKRKKFTKDELLNILKEEPARFSPNVLLRPICQDFLFPTAMYIAGPGEVSYFAQVIPMYKEFGLQQPIVYPRSSITILESNHKDIIEKYKLKFLDFFSEEDTLNEKILGLLSDINVDSAFDDSRKSMMELFEKLKNEIESLDPTLADAVEKGRDRSLNNVDQLLGKAKKARERQHETALRQIEKVRTILYPNGNLQERELSFIYFAHKYGLDIVKWIFDQVLINKFEHQVIEL